MYKDVWKRVVALAVAVCLIGASIQWPEKVMAAEVKDYHTYQHGSGSTSGWIDTNTAAAVFTVGENTSGEAEILDSISFHAHINEEGKDAKATVSYYLNPQGTPDSGTFVHAKTISNLTEGQNTVEARMESQELQAGTSFAVVVSLTGASLGYYSAGGAGQTYLSVNGSWQDASVNGQCVAIRAYTYDVGDDGEDGQPWLEQLVSAFSLDDADEDEPLALATGLEQLNKVNMIVPVGEFGEIILNNAGDGITWSVQDTTIAQIKGFGTNGAIVQGLKSGDTTITAEYLGETYTCALKVSASLEDATVQLTPDSVVYDGNNHKPLFDVMLGDTELEVNTEYQVSCASVAADNTETVVDMTKTDAFVNAGTYRFKFTGQGTYGGTEKTVDYVIAPKQITDETVQVVLGTWNPPAPAADPYADTYITNVIDTARSNAELQRGTESGQTGDFYLTYTKNSADEVTAINIIGRGNYAGTKTCTTPVSITNAQIKIDGAPFIFLGEAWQPSISVAVKVNGGEEQIIPSDGYDVVYQDNVNTGEATILVEGKNGYFGTASTTFQIQAKDIQNTDNAYVQTPVEVFVANAVGLDAPDITVTYNGKTLEAGANKDYEIISWQNDIATGKGECVLEGHGNFTGSRTESYKVTTNNLNDIANGIKVTDMVYTGDALEPGVTLTFNGTPVTALSEDTDYVVTYTNNVNVGTANVTVQGTGAYAGKLIGEFEIKQADFGTFGYQFKNASGGAESIIDYEVPYSLRMADMKPGVIVTYNGKTLTEGKEYSLSYSVDTDGKNVKDDLVSAPLKVTVEALDGNYKGEMELPYTVKSCDLETAVEKGTIKVTLDKENFNYTGKPQKPIPTLAYADGTKLESGTDYSYSYLPVSAPTEVGDYTVRITAGTNNNYTGSVDKAFHINRIDIQTLGKITPDTTHGNHVNDYKGTWFAMMWYDDSLSLLGEKDNNKLKLTIYNDDDKLLVEGTDYTLSYENIDQVSTSEKFAKVKITGIGTYTGEREIYYLLAGQLEKYGLSVTDEKQVYTGEELTLQEESIKVKRGVLWAYEELKQNVDYTVAYEDNLNAGTAKVSIEAMDDKKLPTVNGCYRYEDPSQKLNGTFDIAKKDIGDVTSVTLANAIVKDYTGTAVKLTADDIPLFYNGMKLTDADFVIAADSYKNNTSPSDEASVQIDGAGNYTGSRKISFVIRGKSFDGVQAEFEEAIYNGKELNPKITLLKTADGVEIPASNYSYTIADYNNNINAGTGTVTIHGKGEYVGSTAKISFEIKPRDISISDNVYGVRTVEGVQAAYTYTSQEITPKPVVKYQVTGFSTNKLTPDEDYTVSYRNNTNVTNEAVVIITGTGNYTGTVEQKFEIQKKDIAAADIAVAPIPSQEVATGMQAIEPIPDITYQYGTGETDVYCLTSSDYVLEYASNITVGTATITIKGQGNFTGERNVQFHIGNPITDTSKVSIHCPQVEAGTEFVYKGEAYKPDVTVENKTTGSNLEPDTDYEIIYGENKNVGKGTVTVRGIGAYAGEQVIEFEITPKDLADSDVQLAIKGVKDGSYKTAYTGSPIKPKVTLIYNGNTEENGYDVSYGTNNTAVGVVNVSVTARADGNFKGTKTIQNTSAAKFEIVAASIGNGGSTPASGFTMDVVEPQPLGITGTATPTPKLYHNGTALEAGTDFVYSYEKNTVIGTEAAVILTGIGNYTGSVRQKFEIRGSIEGATVEVTDEIWYKDYVNANPGDGIRFDTKIVVTVNGVTLVQGTDYELSYTNNTWVGIATVTVTGKGSYAGTVTKEVPIKADLSEATVTVSDQKYTGSPINAVPIVEYYGTALTEGMHFIIHTYENNTSISNKGATVTIIGNEANGFYGTRTENFSITADAEALTVSGVAESYMYCGSKIVPDVVVKLGSTTLNESDYEVTYGSNTNIGYGTVVVKGKGAYEGLNAKSILFEIVAQDINNLTVLDGKSNVIADREYTGLPILPELTLTAKVGTTTFTLPTSDYTVTAATDNVSVGTVTLEIAGTGNVTGSRAVTFDITPKSLSKPTSGTDKISVQVTQDTYAYDGTAKTPSVIVTYQYGTDTEVRTLEKDRDYTLSYSNNTSVGTASVIVTGIGNYAGSRTVNFTITSQDISVVTVTLPNGTLYPYMGNTVGIEPDVEVTVKGVVLTENKDYTLSYQNNKACGTATVTVTGKGDFSGTTATTFIIEPHSMKAADIVVAAIPNQAYTGSPVVPELTITCGDYKLVKGTDYELTCTGNTEIGQATVTIKGINGFKDSRTEIFKIASSIDAAEVYGLKESYPYTGQQLTEEQLGITEVRIGETVLTTDDYEIAFAAESDGVSAGMQTLVLNGTGSYGGTKEIAITITPKNIADGDIGMTGFADTLPYGEPKQDVILKWGSIELQDGIDYDVAYAPTETAGVYRMTVTGKGNYAGTIEKTFRMETSPVDELTVKDFSSNYTYTGEAIEPKPTVMLGNAELQEGIDYTLSYLNNVNVGVATMNVTGTGTYFAGTKELTFTILRRSINHGTFGEIAVQTYTGKDLKPVVSVKDNGKDLTENTDYTLMYKNNRRTGTASVVVAGKGNYTSTKTIPFAIRPCNTSALNVIGASATTVSLSWNGEGVVTGYEIYRMDANGKWQLAGGTKGTTYTDAKLSAGTSYTYKIRAYVVEEGETYYGEFSEVVTAATSK